MKVSYVLLGALVGLFTLSWGQLLGMVMFNQKKTASNSHTGIQGSMEIIEELAPSFIQAAKDKSEEVLKRISKDKKQSEACKDKCSTVNV